MTFTRPTACGLLLVAALQLCALRSVAQTCTGTYPAAGEAALDASAWLLPSPAPTPWGGNAPPTAAGIGGINCGYTGVVSVPACANNYATIYMCVGNVYTISLCAGDLWDSSLSLTTTMGADVSPATFDNDGCGVVGGLSTLSFAPTISANYRIRIRTNPCAVDSASCGLLQISISPIPLPPANNELCTAQPLDVNATCEPTEATTLWATQSVGVPTPSDCPSSGAFAGSDVWFTAVVPLSGNMAVETSLVTATNIAMAAYLGGGCEGPLTQLACNADAGVPALPNPYLLLTGQVPGDTVWIRVWPEGGSANSGTFTICAYDVISTAVGNAMDGTALRAWPNPVGDHLFVKLGAICGATTSWRMVGSSGRLVGEGLWRGAPVDNQQVVPTAQLGPGCYILQICCDPDAPLVIVPFVKL